MDGILLASEGVYADEIELKVNYICQAFVIFGAKARQDLLN